MEAFIALDEKKGAVLFSLLAFPKFSVVFFLCLVATSFFFSTTVCLVFDVSGEEKQQLSSATCFQVVTLYGLLV